LSNPDSTTAKEELTRPTVGQRITVRIDDVAFGGEGVGRVDGFVVFVPLVIEGETVEAEITEVKKSFARANLVKVVEPAESRVEPECSYFGDCGGCQYQHMAYEAQLAMKQKQIKALFERIGGFSEGKIAPVVPCPQPYNYRNRILIRSQWNGKTKKLLVGFRKRNSHWVVEVDDCKIAEPALNAQIPEVRNNPPNKGGVKVNLRVAQEDWVVPDHSFFQTNYFMLPRMVEVVRRIFQSSGSDHLIDTYCGVGFLGIELASLAKRYAGVEYDHRAILAARENAAKFGGDNGEFVEGRTEHLLPELLAKFADGSTSVILDPPRKGCAAAAIGQLREIRPAQIIYVSCHPATLARDLNALCADGVYRLEQVVPLDMFPHTQHVECVTDLRLNTST
jgi:tRNA/tmRNA/rRNA uracil-C5-methylase (TrmA/RlmC/RlmD family)